MRCGWPSIPDGSSFKAYIAPQAEITVKQTARSTQKIETAKRVIDVRTYALTFQNPGAPLDAVVWTDESGRLLKFEVAAQSLIFVREDLASVATRALVVSREGDVSVRIPGNGFLLAGTLSQPSGAPPPPRPGAATPPIVLVGGSGRRNATRRSPASRSSACSRRRWPTPATSCCATTSAASGRAAAAPKPAR